MRTYKNWAASPRTTYTEEAALEFSSEEVQAAYLYWLSCAGGAVPSKAALAPRAMKKFLGDVAIFERVCSGTYHIRLMGTHLTAVIGEMQGRMIEDALPADTALRWSHVLDVAIATRRPRRIISHLAIGRLEYLEAEVFVAPLRDKNDQITMALGVATFTSGIQALSQHSEAQAYRRA